MPGRDRPLAVIAGAGIAGLTAAWWLGRIGWRTLIVERAPDLHDGGYMLGLSGAGYGTACRMGLESALLAAQASIDENVYRDRRGREIMRLRYRDFLRDVPYVAILRTDLVKILRDALPDTATLRFGTTVAAIETGADRVGVTLSDGTSHEAALLVAADGLRSATRSLLFDEEYGALLPLGYRFAVYDVAAAMEDEADFLSYVEPGHMAEYYRLPERRLAALHVWHDGRVDRIAGPAAYDVLAGITARSHPRVRMLLDHARDAGEPVLTDALLMADMPTWSRGPGVLLGDAAHCLTLVSGQGGGLSMASAERLAEALSSSSSIGAALARHETAMRPAVERLQRRARQSARMFVPATPLGFACRNIVMRNVPRSWLGRYLSSAIRSEIALGVQSRHLVDRVGDESLRL